MNQDLSNNIFDLQSHYKTTAAFLVIKCFYHNKFDLNIDRTYIVFTQKSAYT